MSKNALTYYAQNFPNNKAVVGLTTKMLLSSNTVAYYGQVSNASKPYLTIRLCSELSWGLSHETISHFL